jgi:hypothetical protein
MGADDGRWRGIDVSLKTNVKPAGVCRVDFLPGWLGAFRGADGEYPRAPDAGSVTISVGRDPRILSYIPPEKPVTHLSRGDFEQRALEVVREFIARDPIGTAGETFVCRDLPGGAIGLHPCPAGLAPLEVGPYPWPDWRGD